jgi:hypothetical protein
MELHTLISDPAKAKDRFHELDAKIRAQHAKLEPIREARSKLTQKHQREMDAMNKRQATAAKGLFEMEQERAIIAKVVGNVGEPE